MFTLMNVLRDKADYLVKALRESRSLWPWWLLMWNFAQQLEVHAENQALAMSPPSDSFFERDDVMTFQAAVLVSGKWQD